MEGSSTKKIHYGYVIIGALMLLGVIQGIVGNTDGLFYVPVSTELGISLAAYGLNMTIGGYAMAFLISVYTKLFNKVSIKMATALVVLDYALVVFMRAIGTDIWFWYISGFIMSFGGGILIFMINPIMINNWFAKKQGFWIGICAACQGAGGWLFQMMGGWIIENYGWRACYWVWTAVTLAIGLPIALFIIRRTPEDMGLKPVGYEEKADGVSAAVGGEKPAVTGVPAKKARTTLAFWCMIGFICFYAVSNVYNSYFNAYCQQELDMGPALAGMLSSLVMLGRMIGGPLSGWICDKNMKVGCITCCLGGLCASPLILLLGRSGNAVIVVAMLIFGWTMASLNIVGPQMIRYIFGDLDFASIWGNMSTAQNLLGGACYTVWGMVIGVIGYVYSMWTLPVFYIIAIICGSIAVRTAPKMRQFDISSK